MDIETAKKIVETLEGVNRSLYELLPYLKEQCPEEEYQKFQREVARVSNGIDMNFYPLILSQYPELNPLSNSD